MLVLSRRVNETIVLPELGITIEVLNSYGTKTRIGISAPDSIRILRGELVERNEQRSQRQTIDPVENLASGTIHNETTSDWISSADRVTIDPNVMLTSVARLGT